jgi:hypothetical protein
MRYLKVTLVGRQITFCGAGAGAVARAGDRVRHNVGVIRPPGRNRPRLNQIPSIPGHL